MASKIRLNGYETFYIREGWLRKGTKAIVNNSKIFSDIIHAIDDLGVGANMVKAIRYWLQATGLTEETKKGQFLTEDFGDIIIGNDPYFEDIGTLFLLHYKLVSNKDTITSWNLFFNKLDANEYSKKELYKQLYDQINIINNSFKISEKSLNIDCNSIIKSYIREDIDFQNPEENLICPLSELGLLKKDKFMDEDIYVKKSPDFADLDKLIVLYVILDNLNDKEYVSINDLVNDENNIGRVFNLTRNKINEYIDMLQGDYLTITRTSGLNIVYPKKRNKVDILKQYYNKI